MNGGKSVLRFLMVAAMPGLLAWGQAASAAEMPNHAPPAPPDAAEFRAAIAECAGAVAKDEHGRPERKAMDACMQAKGYAPPRGGPEEHERPPRPRDD